jgi:hypothetical protein
LIDKGELPASSLRSSTRRQLELSKIGKLKAELGEVKTEPGLIQPADDKPKESKDIGNRATPCRWSSYEKKKFIELLKTMGKQFAKIAEIIKTKNEQQCRTKALIMYNKLKLNCFDSKLMEILAPTKPVPNPDSKKRKRYTKPKTEAKGEGGDETQRVKTEDGLE